MFANCTFSFVNLHVFGFINANPLEDQEDPAPLISGVLKPKADFAKTKLVRFCIHTDSGSVTSSQPQQGVKRGVSKSDLGPAVSSDRLF